jgi:hypothetical protein
VLLFAAQDAKLYRKLALIFVSDCAGVVVLTILLPSVATERQSVDFVFTSFNIDNGLGIHSRPYIFLLGLLMSQYTMTGYDSSAYLVKFIFLDPEGVPTYALF